MRIFSLFVRKHEGSWGHFLILYEVKQVLYRYNERCVHVCVCFVFCLVPYTIKTITFLSNRAVLAFKYPDRTMQ